MLERGKFWGFSKKKHVWLPKQLFKLCIHSCRNTKERENIDRHFIYAKSQKTITFYASLLRKLLEKVFTNNAMKKTGICSMNQRI